MLVPAPMVQLNEAHAALGQAPGDQAIVGIATGCLTIGPVQVEYVLRFALQIDQLRDRRLHAIRQLVLRDARPDFAVAGRFEALLVEAADRVDHLPAGRRVDAWRVDDIEDDVALIAKFDALVAGRQKTAAPQPVVDGLAALAAAA